LKLSFSTALVISLSLASCALKNAPSRVTVKVADTYSGFLHLTPCREGSKEPVVVDERGNGEISVCPSGDLEIVVIKGTRTVYIPPEKVKVDRTGDGIPVIVTASIPR
jgi:hypothetical protein